MGEELQPRKHPGTLWFAKDSPSPYSPLSLRRSQHPHGVWQHFPNPKEGILRPGGIGLDKAVLGNCSLPSLGLPPFHLCPSRTQTSAFPGHSLEFGTQGCPSLLRVLMVPRPSALPGCPQCPFSGGPGSRGDSALPAQGFPKPNRKMERWKKKKPSAFPGVTLCLSLSQRHPGVAACPVHGGCGDRGWAEVT